MIRPNLFAALLIYQVFGFLCSAQSFTTPAGEQPKIANPILRGFNPDPSIVRFEDDYYIATSTFEWFPGVQIHHSRDLVNWQLIGHPLARKSQLDMAGNAGSGGVWAPCLSYDDGLFYLIYSNVRNLSGGFVDVDNYLVTAININGPWSEPVFLNSGGFDPTMFHDTDGRKWLLNMIWDFRSENKSGGILIQEYDPVQKKLIGKQELIFKGTAFGGTEAPHIYKHGGYYHLMTAEGGTGYNHVVTMARSKNIHGPYEPDPGNPILTSRNDSTLALQKAGHASLVQIPNGDWFITYLVGRPLPETKQCNLGRETSIQRCFWNEDGWLRMANGSNTPDLVVEAPGFPEFKIPEPEEVYEFDDDTLQVHFNTLREPFDPSWGNLTERPGFLRLYGRHSPTSRFNQSLVARRLQHFWTNIETSLEFNPTDFRQMAGLISVYNEKNFIYLRISYNNDIGRNVAVIKVDRGKPEISQLVDIPDEGTIHLRASYFYQKLKLFWSNDGTMWKQVGPTYDAGKLSDEYCRGFTGTFVGMSVNDMTGQKIHTDFDYFRYKEKHR